MSSSSQEPTTVNSIDGIPLEGLLHAVSPSLGSVLLVHGITVDMHEGGAFDRLAGCFTAAGFGITRTAYRRQSGE